MKTVFSSFTDLITKFGLPRSHFFRYLQIRHFIWTQYPSFPSPPSTLLWEELLKLSPSQKALISRIYTGLMLLNNKPVLKAKVAREKELNVDITDDWWAKAIDRMSSTSSFACLGLIQFKAFHGTHFSKAKLAEIYPDKDDSCNRCVFAPADHSHMFFSGQDWTIFGVLSSKHYDVLQLNLQPCPLTAIFGVPVVPSAYSRPQADVIVFSSLLARRKILFEWKSPKPPLSSSWLSRVMFFVKLEKIKYSLRGSMKKFDCRWRPSTLTLISLSRFPMAK